MGLLTARQGLTGRNEPTRAGEITNGTRRVTIKCTGGIMPWILGFAAGADTTRIVVEMLARIPAAHCQIDAATK
ncbi:MAG: hypothetical protein AAGC59_07150, partial [Brucella pseudogrignonensis]